MNRRAFFLGAAMVLLGSFVAIALRSFAEAAFLGAYGPKQMPWLLIANASGFAAATLGYDALTRHLRAGAIDLVLLVLLGIAAAAAPKLLRAGVPPAVLVVALAAGSQVAGLALWNRVAASVAGRDARRYLPRAGAAVTAGGAIAGLGAGALIPRVGLSAIPLIGAAVTAVVAIVCVVQERALVTGGAPGGTPTGASPGGAATAGIAIATPAPGASRSLSPVQRHLLSSLIVVAILEGIVATVIDLQFVTAVKAHYRGQDLAVALALFYGGTNMLLLLLQIAAVPHLLVTRSLTTTAAIHPVLVILSYAGFAAAPGFIGIAGTRTTDQVLRFATSRTSQEVSLSAFPPLPRARWKVLLRGAVWPAGAALAALVLLLVGPPALREPARLAGIAIGIAVAWAIAARVAARRFQAALAAPLGIRESKRDDPRRIDMAALEQWTHAAGADDPQQAALARAAIARARVDASDLADHLRHDEPAVRAALFDQLARTPSPALRGELRTALAVEDDDRALVLGIRALTIAGDDAAVVRGEARAGLSREVDQAVASARAMLREGDALAELKALLARDALWAVALVRARPGAFLDDVLDAQLRDALANAATRAAAFAVIARVGPELTRPLLAQALEAGDADAIAAIEDIDPAGAASLALSLRAFSPLARAALARALGSTSVATNLVAHLIHDADPEVAYAALRSALAITRGGGRLPTADAEAAYDTALAALVAHLDARDAIAAIAVASNRERAAADVSRAEAALTGDAAAWSSTWSAHARAELEVATRRCAARVLWAAAVEAANAGRDPAPIAAAARHLIGAREADRKRALDVVQEQQARPQLLAVIERWLGLPRASHDESKLAALSTFDPWLARLGAGETRDIERTLADLRRPALFASIAGPALAALAERAKRETVHGTVFTEGDDGDTMFVVTAGALVARRAGSDERRVSVGDVVGELSVLTHAPRAATLTAIDSAEVLVIDRASFAAVSRRAPELVLGLSSTLAGWLAPNRPDVL